MAADLSFIPKYLPSKEQTPWMTSRNCRVFFDPQYHGELFIVKDFYAPETKSPNYLAGQEGMTIRLPEDMNKPLKMNDQVLEQKAEEIKNADGSVTLNFEIYELYFDTGGYFSRSVATIHLTADRKLKGVKASRGQASKRFVFFGAYKEFKDAQIYSCE